MWDFFLTDLSNLGLLLDIIGAIFIFLFGIPKQPFFIRTDNVVITNERKSKYIESALMKLYKFMEYSGLILLIFGFTLQIISKI